MMMTSRFPALAAMAITLLAGAAKADEKTDRAFLDGNALLTRCTDAGPVEVECIGYVEGIADAMAAIQAHDGSLQGSRACIPDTVLSTQVRDIVTRFLREHPELRHVSAASVVAHALAEAFPCPPAAQP